MILASFRDTFFGDLCCLIVKEGGKVETFFLLLLNTIDIYIYSVLTEKLF